MSRRSKSKPSVRPATSSTGFAIPVSLDLRQRTEFDPRIVASAIKVAALIRDNAGIKYAASQRVFLHVSEQRILSKVVTAPKAGWPPARQRGAVKSNLPSA